MTTFAELEAIRIARGPVRASESAGPTTEQWEAVDRIEEDHQHVSLDWHPFTGNLYVEASDGRRIEALYRVEEDGRAVLERMWA